MKLVNSILYYNIILCVAAVVLTISAQIQLGFEPNFRLYYILVFFATLFEYNKIRIITFLRKVKDHYPKFMIILFYISMGSGILLLALKTKLEVLIAFLCLGIITMFYSNTILGNNNTIFKLREIPYFKIFIIAFVWSALTVFLPALDFGVKILNSKVILLFSERLFFIIAIAIPFDIRDIGIDQKSGLKTIPILINKNNALLISYFSLAACVLISLFHYQKNNSFFILLALGISLLSTALFLNSKFKKTLNRFYYYLLDATLIIQGGLVLAFSFLNQN